MSYNILICDDEKDIVSALKIYLEAEGYRTFAAANGREALDFIAKKKPSLVLLDLMMPEIDGYEVLRRLREDPETKDLRIVILSALNSNEDIVKGFNLGANDFITKPIILEKLTSCVITQLQLVELAGK